MNDTQKYMPIAKKNRMEITSIEIQKREVLHILEAHRKLENKSE